LRLGPFRTAALAPHQKPLTAAKLVLRNLNEHYLPRVFDRDWPTIALVRVLTAELKETLRTLPAAETNLSAAEGLAGRLNSLYEVASLDERVDLAILQEIAQQLRYANSLVRAQVQRLRVMRPDNVPQLRVPSMRHP
ncbi:MAG: hypothetical protein HY692_01250, partial [Cyanobacteria bacterium NC_groundwater_1444_Ag_S-0.65um_54_12]|nr:hypothetical protein [Cyanobacteria bacterium NC_groundwater_1444_Ag_S-0.65um_54_12]